MLLISTIGPKTRKESTEPKLNVPMKPRAMNELTVEQMDNKTANASMISTERMGPLPMDSKEVCEMNVCKSAASDAPKTK